MCFGQALYLAMLLGLGEAFKVSWPEKDAESSLRDLQCEMVEMRSKLLRKDARDQPETAEMEFPGARYIISASGAEEPKTLEIPIPRNTPCWKPQASRSLSASRAPGALGSQALVWGRVALVACCMALFS